MSTEPENRTNLEAALAALAPAASRLDRDGLMYGAGRASVPRRSPWLAACGFAGLSLVLAGWLALRPPGIVERTVVVTVPAPPPAGSSGAGAVPTTAQSEATEFISSDDPDPGPSRNPLLELRRQLLKHGDIPLPPAPRTTLAAPPARPLEMDLGFPPGSLDRLEPARRSPSSVPW